MISYRFALKDIELIVKLDIKVIEIEIDMLKMDGEVQILLQFADLFRQMKHLEEFDFDSDDFEVDGNHPPMEKLTDIPIKKISTWLSAL